MNKKLLKEMKKNKPSRVWGNYFLNAWHPDAKVNNASCSPFRQEWPGFDRDGMNKTPFSSPNPDKILSGGVSDLYINVK